MLGLRVIAALLIIVGLFTLLRIDPVLFVVTLTAPARQKRHVKARGRQLAGKRAGPLQRQIENAKAMLDSAGMGSSIHYYQIASIVLALMGASIGLILNNLIASVVLAAGLALMPILHIQVRTGDYIRHINDSLETALNVVTSTYVQSGDLIDAVSTSLHAIPAPMDDVFKGFLVDVEMIDANVVRAIHNMSRKVDRRYFHEWCTVLIQSQSDRKLRFALPGIVERLSQMRHVQMELDTTIRRSYVDYLIIVGVLLGVIPLMAFMMPDWVDALLNTLAGKITLGVVLSGIFLTSFWVVSTNKPIEME